MTTFSRPPIIKYPPCSYGHSPLVCNLLFDISLNKQLFECNIVGIFKKSTSKVFSDKSFSS